MTTSQARFLKDYQTPDFTIETIDLEIELDDQATRVKNCMLIQRLGEHDRALELNGEHVRLVSIAINQQSLSAQDYQCSDEMLTLNTSLDRFELTVETVINPEANTALEGLYKSGDAFCTQCEAEGFRRITYYLDRPDVMAVFTTKVIADKVLYPQLLSNGNKVAVGELDDNKHFVTWHDPHKKPSYLFAMVAGDFDLLADHYVTKSGRDVALELYVDKGNKYRAHHAMESLKKSMTWDEERFALEYDLDVYMIVAVDFFNMGAMENKGLNIFNSKYVLADIDTATDSDYFNVEAVIAHEYFHNWTGNRVTCRDWFQLSLKEGLTVFRDQEFSSDMHSASVNRIKNVRLLRAQQFAEDAGPMAHPIRPEKVKEMNNFYTLTVYEKGAEVIRMIYTLLGREKFNQGIALYFKRHDGQAVTCDDFVNAMQDASGIDLTLFRRWYGQSGTPTINVTTEYNALTKQLIVTIEQIHPETADGQLKQDLHIPINVELIQPESASEQWLLNLTESKQQWVFDHCTEQTVMAVLGDFSAPVNIRYQQSDQALMTIMTQAENTFLRWDAGQALLARYLVKATLEDNYQFPDSLVSAFKQILLSDNDKDFIAEQITLPGFDELIAMTPGTDVVKVTQAIKSLTCFLANKLQVELTQLYQDCSQVNGKEISAKAIAARVLKNTCLHYLSYTSSGNELVVNHFEQAVNMTDSLAAIKTAAKANLPYFDNIMQVFETRWLDDTLVLDKWFTINAMLDDDSVLQRVTQLMRHPKFTLENPNRVRALFGAFSNLNPAHFHRGDGAGYKLLADLIVKLDKINPQVAARLITPLIQFQSLDKQRQGLMTTELARIAQSESLSADLEEKISATLSA